MEWVSAIFLGAQIIILVIGYFKLYRHRVIYGIDTDVLRMPHSGGGLEKNHINDKLKNGAYTILQIVQRPDHDVEIIYGQLREHVKK